jgi:hypothetical protein
MLATLQFYHGHASICLAFGMAIGRGLRKLGISIDFGKRTHISFGIAGIISNE